MKITNFGKLCLLMVLGTICFTNCNDNDNDESTELDSLNGVWNVKTISGGLAGIDDEYETGLITWSFSNQTLTVENNESQGNIYSGFESGTYTYSTTEVDGINYIIINDVEYGGYTLSTSNLIIDQNTTMSGSGADGFILQLER